LLAKNKKPPLKKRQPQNARSSKQKTSDEKRGNHKMQWAQNKRHPIKKEATQNARAQNKRPPIKKEATPKRKGIRIKDI
jgi:hypothetical protein